RLCQRASKYQRHVYAHCAGRYREQQPPIAIVIACNRLFLGRCSTWPASLGKKKGNAIPFKKKEFSQLSPSIMELMHRFCLILAVITITACNSENEEDLTPEDEV